MSLKSILYALFAGLALAACQGKPASSLLPGDKGASGIVGGDLALNNDQSNDPARFSVGLLNVERKISYTLLDSPFVQDDKVSCTGVLIEPDVMLTAAHCVIDSSMLTAFQSGTAEIHGNVFFPQTFQRIPIKKAVFHSEFSNTESFDDLGQSIATTQNDLAVILLAFPTSAPLHAAALPPFPLMESTFLRTRIFGFGLTSAAGLTDNDGDPEDQPQLRFVDLQGHFLKARKKIFYSQIDGHGVCYGDSGSPHFSLSDERSVELVGISSSLTTRSSDSIDACMTKSEAIAVSEYGPWIVAAKAKLRDAGSAEQAVLTR